MALQYVYGVKKWSWEVDTQERRKSHSEKMAELEAKHPNLWAEIPVWKSLDIDIGWYDLVEEAIDRARAVCPDFQLMQVKEKFGGLRIYATNISDEAHEILADAEARSFKICEKCGAAGVNGRTDTGWIKTFCQKHGAEESGWKPGVAECSSRR